MNCSSSLGFDRVTRSFFQFLVDGQLEYTSQATIASISALEEGVDRFRKIALLLFGNVKYAFKTLSRDAGLLADQVERLSPIPPEDFGSRHEPIRPIDIIDGGSTYYLGYIVEEEIRERLRINPRDAKAIEEDQRRQTVVVS